MLLRIAAVITGILVAGDAFMLVVPSLARSAVKVIATTPPPLLDSLHLFYLRLLGILQLGWAALLISFYFYPESLFIIDGSVCVFLTLACAYLSGKIPEGMNPPRFKKVGIYFILQALVLVVIRVAPF